MCDTEKGNFMYECGGLWGKVDVDMEKCRDYNIK